MQVQNVLIREVLLAFRAPVHVHFLVVHIIPIKRCECKWFVWGKQALHNRWLFREYRLCIQMYKLDVDRLFARERATGVF